MPIHCLLALALSGLLTTPSPASPQLAVMVAAHLRDDDRAAIAFEVKSTGQHPIRLFESALPWTNYASAVIVVVTLGGEDIRPEWPIDDPSARTVVLHAGQELRGVVDLYDRFPSLKKRRAQQDLLVFWSYQLTAIEPAARCERVGGWWLLAKKN